MKKKLLLFATILLGSAAAFAQQTDSQAELMLVYQRSYGGWPKAIGSEKVDYKKQLSTESIAKLRATADAKDGTIDNNATTREIVHLIKAHELTKNTAYLDAAKRGLDYLFKAQYENGGWPQFYPDTKGYRTQITFNDNAIANVLNLMYDVSRQKDGYAALGAAYGARATASMQKGVDIVLKTQYVYKGKKTGWAAQYDEKLMTPAKARAFELPSLASSESAGILKFLMRLPEPSAAVREAVQAGMQWFDDVKIVDASVERVDDATQESGENVLLRKTPGSTLWARFYDLEEMKPMFVDRDGVMKRNLSEIGNERRTGYAWYGTWGTSLQAAYEKWKIKNKL